ncbi:ABC transporter ATP-binding protein [Cellulophaga baltica]|uniref:Putative ABC transport system ATP-binding protein n=1 Tax=Cellulophaga baltica TaxID=76594 RepID=A0A1G7HT23_9FLAO|nr:ATP-binding cassette domain-containing protein [Cellulophaga baltica]SDF03590.1 putative ABC transport system ATP-binding protein [Cellulophaga baltica]
MIQTDHLTFQYKKKDTSFSFPDLTLKQNENLLILGKSGIGKTTLLHLIAGLLKPKHGTIRIDAIAINTLSNRQLDKFRGEKIGLVFQKNHAISSLSVLENLQARLYFSKHKIEPSAIDVLLKQLDLHKIQHHKAHQLSEGQLQRLGIASAIIHEPSLILADEPTSNLDDENCKIVIALLIAQAKKTKVNLIVITHDSRIKPFFQNVITL